VNNRLETQNTSKTQGNMFTQPSSYGQQSFQLSLLAFKAFKRSELKITKEDEDLYWLNMLPCVFDVFCVSSLLFTKFYVTTKFSPYRDKQCFLFIVNFNFIKLCWNIRVMQYIQLYIRYTLTYKSVSGLDLYE
jgi:amino acid transporter